MLSYGLSARMYGQAQRKATVKAPSARQRPTIIASGIFVAFMGQSFLALP